MSDDEDSVEEAHAADDGAEEEDGSGESSSESGDDAKAASSDGDEDASDEEEEDDEDKDEDEDEDEEDAADGARTGKARLAAWRLRLAWALTRAVPRAAGWPACDVSAAGACVRCATRERAGVRRS